MSLQNLGFTVFLLWSTVSSVYLFGNLYSLSINYICVKNEVFQKHSTLFSMLIKDVEGSD